MKQKFFNLTLLSDIVLQKSSNTQGKNESRDFIGGSVIFGIVAKHYDEFSNPFAIFHSGAVRFGEAKPLISGKISYKIPLCFFAPKEAKDLREVYNALFCDFATKPLQDLQPRQIRSGYINEDLQKAELQYRYTQKVNLQAKSTKDNQMFGYEAICKSAVFGFVVEFDECVSNDDIEKITQILCGTHFIGKSKNAEYGEVLIESSTDFYPIKHDLNLNTQDSSQDFSQNFSQDFSKVALYVASQLALFDSTMPTFIPNAKNLGLDSAQILWEKTHIKTKIHTPYNQKRKAKDSARLIIEQGSVITLRNLSQSDKDKLKNGKILCGGFLSEGYGEILVNPSFLMQGKDNKPFALNQSKIDTFTLQTNDSTDSNLIAYVKDLRDLQMREVESANAIDDFIITHKAKFSKVTNAQWGAIRAFAQIADDKALKDRIICYINEERLQDKWEEGKEILEQFINAYDRDSIALLATRMPKADLDLSQDSSQKSARDFTKDNARIFARKSNFRVISGGGK